MKRNSSESNKGSRWQPEAEGLASRGSRAPGLAGSAIRVWRLSKLSRVLFVLMHHYFSMSGASSHRHTPAASRQVRQSWKCQVFALF